MQQFRDLKVWQRAQGFVLSIYKFTSTFPVEERYTLVSQLRRASLSISSNIAEGSRRRSQTDFAHFLNMSEGSSAEMESLLVSAKALQYGSAEEADLLIKEANEIGRMLYTLRSKVEDTP
jgi:four helix bundle protein